MALKGQLRALEARVRWFETEGLYIHLRGLNKFLELAQKTSDEIARNPAFAARWKADGNDGIPLPPPRVRERSPAPPAEEELPPQPKLAALEPVVAAEPLPASLPIVVESPQCQAIPAPTPAPLPAPAPPALPPREPPPDAQPKPPPDLQIRPVRWRHRTLQDDLDDSGHDFTKCLTDYDVTRGYGDDYDDG